MGSECITYPSCLCQSPNLKPAVSPDGVLSDMNELSETQKRYVLAQVTRVDDASHKAANRMPLPRAAGPSLAIGPFDTRPDRPNGLGPFSEFRVIEVEQCSAIEPCDRVDAVPQPFN